MNKVILIGRLGQDAKNEHEALKFSVATNRNVKKDEEWTKHTEWHDCIMYKFNDYLKQNLLKGALISVEGEIRYKKTDTRYYTNIFTHKVTILEKIENASQQPASVMSNNDDLPF